LSCSLKNTTNHTVQGQGVMPWWSSHVLACYSVLEYVIWERGKKANNFFLFWTTRHRRV